MANTAWKTRSASEKQIAFIQKLADEKAIGDLEESIQEKVADVASGQSISGGEASEVIDALIKAPRKAKPSAGFAPLTSDIAERRAKAAKAKATAEEYRAEADAATAAAGGTTSEGRCTGCRHSGHSDTGCGEWIWHFDTEYPCGCKATTVGTAATQDAGDKAMRATQYERYATEAGYAAQEIKRGDFVVVARGRKVPKGSKGQVAKVSQGNYGLSAFLILDDGSKVWTALANIDHQEA